MRSDEPPEMPSATDEDMLHIVSDLSLKIGAPVPQHMILTAFQEVSQMVIAAAMLKLWRKGLVSIDGLKEGEIVWKVQEKKR
jgi:hypothetical protein